MRSFIAHSKKHIAGKILMTLACLLLVVPLQTHAVSLGAIPSSDGMLEGLKNLECTKTTGPLACNITAFESALSNFDWSGISVNAIVKGMGNFFSGLAASAAAGATSYDGIARVTGQILLKSNASYIMGHVKNLVVNGIPSGAPAFVQNIATHLLKVANDSVGAVTEAVKNSTACNFYDFSSLKNVFGTSSSTGGINFPKLHLPDWELSFPSFNFKNPLTGLNISNPFSELSLPDSLTNLSFLNSSTTQEITNALKCTLGVPLNAAAGLGNAASNAAGAIFASFDGGGGWEQWDKVAANTANNPVGAAMITQQQAYAAASAKAGAENQMVSNNNGFRASTDASGNVTDPGAVLSQQLNYALNNGGQLSLSGVHTISDLVSQMIAQQLASTIQSFI